MPEIRPHEFFASLDFEDADQWWSEFLNQYSAQIFQVVNHFESDADSVADCFQFVCTCLVENRFQRLRKFKVNGPAKFSTWLRAVVRNLCLDWHRKRFGRRRLFHSITQLSSFDQEVFRLLYHRGATFEDSLAILTSQFPNITAESVDQSQERIEKQLTPSQRWILASHAANSASTESVTEESLELVREIPDYRPDPEKQAIQNQTHAKLRTMLRKIGSKDRLLLRLRFEQELTLEQCAKLMEFGNAQRVDRQLKKILSRLRSEMNLGLPSRKT